MDYGHSSPKFIMSSAAPQDPTAPKKKNKKKSRPKKNIDTSNNGNQRDNADMSATEPDTPVVRDETHTHMQ